MEEMVVQERPGLFSRFVGLFARRQEEVETIDRSEIYTSPNSMEISDESYSTFSNPIGVRQPIRSASGFSMTVRKNITAFEDAMAAANGLKKGDAQILNLTATDPLTKSKIVDFMSGVNFAHDGHWEEIGQDMYLIAPAHARVECAPAAGRIHAIRN